jgi:Tfp pilus assembly protein FimT
MVTVAIAAILMAIAAPSFSIFIDNQKLLTTATEFYSAVNMTRSEAIKRGAQVTLAANDGVAGLQGGQCLSTQMVMLVQMQVKRRSSP